MRGVLLGREEVPQLAAGVADGLGRDADVDQRTVLAPTYRFVDYEVLLSCGPENLAFFIGALRGHDEFDQLTPYRLFARVTKDGFAGSTPVEHFAVRRDGDDSVRVFLPESIREVSAHGITPPASRLQNFPP